MPDETYFLNNMLRRVASQKDATRKNVIYFKQISFVPDNNNQLRNNESRPQPRLPFGTHIRPCTQRSHYR